MGCLRGGSESNRVRWRHGLPQQPIVILLSIGHAIRFGELREAYRGSELLDKLACAGLSEVALEDQHMPQGLIRGKAITAVPVPKLCVDGRPQSSSLDPCQAFGGVAPLI